MRRHLPAAVMAALILTAGTIHGRWTNRWARATELQHAVDHLGKLPLTLGDWEGRENVLDEKEQKLYAASRGRRLGDPALRPPRDGRGPLAAGPLRPPRPDRGPQPRGLLRGRGLRACPAPSSSRRSRSARPPQRRSSRWATSAGPMRPARWA